MIANVATLKYGNTQLQDTIRPSTMRKPRTVKFVKYITGAKVGSLGQMLKIFRWNFKKVKLGNTHVIWEYSANCIYKNL